MFVSFNYSTGIRSVKFRGDILTIGTGNGSILFYDLRATKYMQLRFEEKDVIFSASSGTNVRTLQTRNYHFI